MPAADGAGVQMTRLIGTRELDHVDPFLLLDVFQTANPDDYSAGFPPHPHRGFEAVTYMFAGRMRHKDNAGNEGVIESGGVQWMTAGRGIVHSEMPEQQDGLMWGTQLWINLPAEEKMTAPAYRDFAEAELPAERRAGDIDVRVIAGTTVEGTSGAVTNRPTDPLYLDVRLPADARLAEAVPASHAAIVFVTEGSVGVETREPDGATTVEAGSLAVLGDGDAVELSGKAPASRLLLIAGRVLGEPISRGGPFVMNTEAEIKQAFSDYRSGKL